MKRHEWTFEFTAKKLAEAATEKKKHHESRLKVWTDAKENVIKEVRESGIDVDEGVDVGSYHSNKVRTPRVTIRDDLQGKLSECQQKIIEHREKVSEYDGWVQWVQVLQANAEKSLQLNADDYLFFFGK